jgi:hypothetical protein
MGLLINSTLDTMRTSKNIVANEVHSIIILSIILFIPYFNIYISYKINLIIKILNLFFLVLENYVLGNKLLPGLDKINTFDWNSLVNVERLKNLKADYTHLVGGWDFLFLPFIIIVSLRFLTPIFMSFFTSFYLFFLFMVVIKIILLIKKKSFLIELVSIYLYSVQYNFNTFKQYTNTDISEDNTKIFKFVYKLFHSYYLSHINTYLLTVLATSINKDLAKFNSMILKGSVIGFIIIRLITLGVKHQILSIL